MDIIEGITGAVAAINGSLTAVKTLKDIDKGIDEAEFKLRIAEITSALADAKIALAGAQLQASEKDKEIHQLKSLINEKNNSTVINGYRFEVDEQGNPSGLAFCPGCYGGSGKQIQLIDAPHSDYTKCPTCDKVFEKAQSKK